MYDSLAHLSFPLNEVFFWSRLTNRSPVTHALLLPWVTAGKGSLCPREGQGSVQSLSLHVCQGLWHTWLHISISECAPRLGPYIWVCRAL